MGELDEGGLEGELRAPGRSCPGCLNLAVLSGAPGSQVAPGPSRPPSFRAVVAGKVCGNPPSLRAELFAGAEDSGGVMHGRWPNCGGCGIGCCVGVVRVVR
jgi:hypothetical protein